MISFFFLQILKSLYPSPIEDPRKVQPLISTGVDMKLRCRDSNTTEKELKKIKVAKTCITIDIDFGLYSKHLKMKPIFLLIISIYAKVSGTQSVFYDTP